MSAYGLRALVLGLHVYSNSCVVYESGGTFFFAHVPAFGAIMMYDEESP